MYSMYSVSHFCLISHEENNQFIEEPVPIEYDGGEPGETPRLCAQRGGSLFEARQQPLVKSGIKLTHTHLPAEQLPISTWTACPAIVAEVAQRHQR
jgi:hypothetical protein